jgi:hypothetical protein
VIHRRAPRFFNKNQFESVSTITAPAWLKVASSYKLNENRKAA